MRKENKYTIITQQHIIIKSGTSTVNTGTSSRLKKLNHKIMEMLNHLLERLNNQIQNKMKKLFIIIAISVATTATAQSTQDKINKANYDLYRANQTIQNTNNSVNSSINTADKSFKTIKDGANKMMGWLNSNSKMEEKKDSVNSNPSKTNTNIHSLPIPTADASSSRTIITVNNCDFNTLRDIANSLTGNSNIKSVEKSFSDNIASFTLAHTGNTDSILDFIDRKYPNRFNIVALRSGIINLALK